MNASSVRRLALLAVVAAASLVSVASTSLAQRDAGAKARGDTRGFWDPSFRRSPARSFEYRSAGPIGESYRSYSYEPVAIAPGRDVTVDVKEARLMLGSTLVGTLEEGRTFKVTRVINGWLGAVVDKDGQELEGWVWHRDVAPTAGPATESSRTATPSRSYRRFSYEPAQPAPIYRSYERRGKEPWQYPKTDPRRYQH